MECLIDTFSPETSLSSIFWPQNRSGHRGTPPLSLAFDNHNTRRKHQMGIGYLPTPVLLPAMLASVSGISGPNVNWPLRTLSQRPHTNSSIQYSLSLQNRNRSGKGL